MHLTNSPDKRHDSSVADEAAGAPETNLIVSQGWGEFREKSGDFDGLQFCDGPDRRPDNEICGNRPDLEEAAPRVKVRIDIRDAGVVVNVEENIPGTDGHRLYVLGAVLSEGSGWLARHGCGLPEKRRLFRGRVASRHPRRHSG